MNIKSSIHSVRMILLFLTFLSGSNLLKGQQTPLYPVSYRVLNPFILNPAIAGSKDFFSVNLLASKYDKINAQILSANTRIPKSGNSFFLSPAAAEFTNFGAGGILFNELNGSSRNIGIGGAGSYHFELDQNALSFLSVGVAGKLVYNQFTGEEDNNTPNKNQLFPAFDAGVYYYNANLFAGLSVTNLLGDPKKTDSSDYRSIQASRQYFFQIGYKLVLSRSLNILLEPSLIVNADDSISNEIKDILKPNLQA